MYTFYLGFLYLVGQSSKSTFSQGLHKNLPRHSSPIAVYPPLKDLHYYTLNTTIICINVLHTHPMPIIEKKYPKSLVFSTNRLI